MNLEAPKNSITGEQTSLSGHAPEWISGNTGEQSHQSGFVKEFVNSLLYNAAESPWKGIKQLVGAPLPDLNIASQPQTESAGTSKWFAQQIGGAIGSVIPFAFTAVIMKKCAFAEGSTINASRIPLGLSLKQSAITGFVSEFVTRPATADGASALTERTLNGLGGSVNMIALSASSAWLGKVLPLGTTTGANLGFNILRSTITGAASGVPTGLVSAEFNALRSGQFLPTATEAEQSVLSMVVGGGVLGGGHIVAEKTATGIGSSAEHFADSWRMYKQPELRPALILKDLNGELGGRTETPLAPLGNPLGSNPPLSRLDAIAKQRGYLYEPVRGQDLTQTEAALAQSNQFARKFEIAEPLVDGFQALNGMANTKLWEVVTGKPFPTERTVTIVVDRAQDSRLSKLIEEAKQRFVQPTTNSETLPQDLAAFVREKLNSPSYKKTLDRIRTDVDSGRLTEQELAEWRQNQQNRHAQQMSSLTGKRVLLGTFADLAQRDQGFGVCIQDAILYKVLADEIGLHGTTLVLGFGGRGKMARENPQWTPQHAWNEVHQNGRLVPIDVINGRCGDETNGMLKPGRDVLIDTRPTVLANWLAPMLESWNAAQTKANALVKSIAKTHGYARLPDAISASEFMGDSILFGRDSRIELSRIGR
ncbi:hypothetical protein BH10CYA1_BH10CYA1_28940 [soil metagenome]